MDKGYKTNKICIISQENSVLLFNTQGWILNTNIIGISVPGILEWTFSISNNVTTMNSNKDHTIDIYNVAQ